MCVHFFGTLDSPCVANYTVKKTAIDHKAKYDYDIIDAVHKNFYMDNYLGAYRNIGLVKETVVNITKLLSEGGFRITKWIPNSNSLHEVLPQSEMTKSCIEDNSMRNETEKIKESCGIIIKKHQMLNIVKNHTETLKGAFLVT